MSLEPPDLAGKIDDHLTRLSATYGRFVMKWSLVINLVWWPTDPLLMDTIPGAVEAFRTFHFAVIACGLLALAVLWRQERLVGWRFVAATTVWLVELGVLAAAISAIGDFSSPWFYGLCTLVLANWILPLRLSVRTPMVSLMGVALFAGYVLARPENLSSPFLGAAIGYVVFVVGVSIAFGHRIYLSTRQAYRQHLELAASTEIIERQRAELHTLVEARTAELRLLAQHLDRAGEAERRRIAAELHDDLGQSVSALRLALATTRRRFARAPEAIGANLNDLDELVDRVGAGIRDAVRLLRPRILDDRGLVEAAQWLIGTLGRSGANLTLEVVGDPSRLAPAGEGVRQASDVASAAFRVLQEALSNALRHAQAHHITVTIDIGPDTLHLAITDDGVGLGGATPGMGLLTMRERARALGGDLILTEPAEATGVQVRCHLPLPADPPENPAETGTWQEAPA